MANDANFTRITQKDLRVKKETGCVTPWKAIAVYSEGVRERYYFRWFLTNDEAWEWLRNCKRDQAPEEWDSWEYGSDME